VDPDPVQDLMTKIEKNTAEKKLSFLIKNYNLLFPRAPYRTSKLQEKPSALKRNIQHLKT
jgi:hypothetical protein